MDSSLRWNDGNFWNDGKYWNDERHSNSGRFFIDRRHWNNHLAHSQHEKWKGVKLVLAAAKQRSSSEAFSLLVAASLRAVHPRLVWDERPFSVIDSSIRTESAALKLKRLYFKPRFKS